MIKSRAAASRGTLILPRRRQPVHALEVAWVDRLALAQDDDAAGLRQHDRDTADRLHQRTPLIRVTAAERAGGFGRIDGLARSALGDEAQQCGFDGVRIRGRNRLILHARRLRRSAPRGQAARMREPGAFALWPKRTIVLFPAA